MNDQSWTERRECSVARSVARVDDFQIRSPKPPYVYCHRLGCFDCGYEWVRHRQDEGGELTQSFLIRMTAMSAIRCSVGHSTTIYSLSDHLAIIMPYESSRCKCFFELRVNVGSGSLCRVRSALQTFWCLELRPVSGSSERPRVGHQGNNTYPGCS
jgi:hypothetical protein